MTKARTKQARRAASAHSASESVRLARSTGLPPQLGKATSEIKVRVPDVIKDDVARAAHEVGMTEADWVRLRLMVWLYGEQQVESMYAQRIRMVAGTFPEAGAARL